MELRAELNTHIADLASRQYGVVTRAQLIALGLAPHVIRHRIRTSRFRPMHRGVYLVGPIRAAHAEAMAAVLACGSGALLSHFSAAAARGHLPARDDTLPVDVTIPGRLCKRPGINVHRVRKLDADERTFFKGIPITSVTRTLVDLAGVAAGRQLERAVACAEREGLVGPQQLAELLVRYKGRTGIGRLRSVLQTVGGPALTKSEAEARFLELVRRARLPAPEVNVRFQGFEIDFLWRAFGIAVEVDGYRFHGSRSSFERDRRRATHLAGHGIHIIPITWRQIVDHGVATAVQLARALALAENRPRAGRGDQVG